MSVVKDEKPLWRAGLALSGPVIVLGVCVLIAGAVNRSLLRSPTLRGMNLLMMAFSVLALGMLLWGMKRGSRRLRRWDVRLSIVANIILLGLLALAFFSVRAADSTPSDMSAPQSVSGGGTGSQ
jgi:hypothetical protein